jgi:hypothetical protein
MKQTAVEWLVYVVQSNIAPNYIPKEIVEQAKEMEKDQIIEAVNFGDARGKITTYCTADEYYNETFKSE